MLMLILLLRYFGTKSINIRIVSLNILQNGEFRAEAPMLQFAE